MANFTTHITIGTIASGMLATMAMAANVVSPEEVVTLAAAGALGSVMPDVDLKDSRPSEAMFTLLALFVSFAVLFNVSWQFSIAEMWILWGGTYLFVRYGCGAIFHRFSYHRGIYHSILAAVFFACFTAVFYRYVFRSNDAVAWLAGAFMFVGYLIHLTLDEIYSVDVFNVRVKASFGTALKLIDRKHMGQTSAMAATTILVFMMTPPFGGFWHEFTSQQVWSGLHQRLLPKDNKWFGFIADRVRFAGEAIPASMGTTIQQGRAITTGSITPAGPAPAGTPASIAPLLMQPPRIGPKDMVAPATLAPATLVPEQR